MNQGDQALPSQPRCESPRGTGVEGANIQLLSPHAFNDTKDKGGKQRKKGGTNPQRSVR